MILIQDLSGRVEKLLEVATSLIQEKNMEPALNTKEALQMKTSIRTHEGRVALVTGAAQGIGQAIAVALAERG